MEIIMQTNVTGRDDLIIMQALAYAIECIEHLPEQWQARSNADDMKKLLDARCNQKTSEFMRASARAAIEQKGLHELTDTPAA